MQPARRTGLENLAMWTWQIANVHLEKLHNERSQLSKIVGHMVFHSLSLSAIDVLLCNDGGFLVLLFPNSPYR